MTAKVSTTVCLAALGGLMAMGLGCGKKKDKQPNGQGGAPSVAPGNQQGSSPTPVTPPVAEPAKPEPVAVPAPAAPEKPEDIAAQCARILEKGWLAVQPALAKVGVAVTPELEKEYRETGYDTRKFLEGCPTVSKGYRDCIEAAANPIENADPCNARAGKDEPQLGRPGIAKHQLFERPELAKGEKSALLAKLRGKWVRKDSFGEWTWTVAAGGKTTAVKSRDGKAEEPQALVIIPKTAIITDIKWPNNSQSWALAVLDDDTFVADGNLMWTPSFIGDGKKFVALFDFDTVFFDDGKCEVVTAYGSVLPATCAFAERDGKRWFDVAFQVPGKYRWGSDELEPTKGSFLVSGEYIVPARLTELAFKRQP